jgi:ribosome-binding factor A
VYVSVLGDERERAATLDGLRSAHGYLQGVIAAQLALKHTPALVFEYDETVARAARLTELMQRGPDQEAPPDD